MWPLPYLLNNQVVGVEVGSNGIKAVQISSPKGRPHITGMGSAPLPIEELTVDILATTLTQCFAQFKHHRGEVIATLPAEQLIYRTLTVPAMDQVELDTAMFYEAQDMLNQEVEDWVVRHCVLGTTPNNHHQVKVLLVAAPRQPVLLLYEAFKAVNLKLMMIDIPYFGLWRFARQQLAETKENCALVHIDADATLLMIVKNQAIHHLRLLPLGYQHIQQQGNDSYVQQLDNAIEIYQQQIPVQKLILSGSGDITYLVTDLSKTIGLPVETVHWPPMLANDQLSADYIMATGLALKGVKVDEI
jgi:type IV pilus assembly protein PilM